MGTPRQVGNLYYDGDDSNITQLKYWRFGVSRGISSPVYMDPVYGAPKYHPAPLYPPKTPIILRLPKPGGGYYSQNQAFIELKKPIWGENGDKPFAEALPTLTPMVSQFIYDPDGQYDWHVFDPNDPSTYPQGEPDNGRGWECEDNDYPGRYYQNIYWDNGAGLNAFTVLSIDRYRKQKINATEPIIVPNPEYPIVMAKREAERALYEQMLKDTFKLFGTYVFPSLQTNEAILQQYVVNTSLQIKLWNKTHALIPDPNWVMPSKEEIEAGASSRPPLVTSWTEADRWTIDTVPIQYHNRWSIKQNGEWKEIPVMNNYWLASSHGGWIYKKREIPENENSSQWDGFVNRTILLVPPKYSFDYKLKKLLGL